MGRRISKEFLHPSILEGVNNKIGNLDSLETDAKGNMVQAINELVEKLDNTTLRDSLASILQEEGVNVAEEDDMASLIIKVDEEFDRKNNEESEDENKWRKLLKLAGYDINDTYNMEDLYNILSSSCLQHDNVKQIACNVYSTFMLKTDGSLWVCGGNNFNTMGIDGSVNYNTFTQVTTNINNDVKEVYCGQSHTFIIKNDGSVWSCGINAYGQLGLGDTNNRTTFTQVTTNINNDVKQIACGSHLNQGSHTFIVKNDGSLWSCGKNENGQLGLGDTTNRTTFTQVTTNINNDVKEVYCGDQCTFILKNDGSLWSCGYNKYYGELGLGDTTNRTTFTQVTTNINNDIKKFSKAFYNCSFIVKNDGSLWGCGANGSGELGLGDNTDRKTFTQVTTNINNDVKDVFCTYRLAFIIKNDGSLWVCGGDSTASGLVGVDDGYTFKQVPVNIPSGIKQIVGNIGFTIIVDNDNRLWVCGDNTSGRLGMRNNFTYETFTPHNGFYVD